MEYVDTIYPVRAGRGSFFQSARYVRWGVLPWPELTTSTSEVTLGKHRLTGDGYLHHANDGGHKDAAKGFEMKVLALRVWLERANQTGRCRCELRMPAG